jgi:hypothetical protein
MLHYRKVELYCRLAWYFSTGRSLVELKFRFFSRRRYVCVLLLLTSSLILFEQGNETFSRGQTASGLVLDIDKQLFTVPFKNIYVTKRLQMLRIEHIFWRQVRYFLFTAFRLSAFVPGSRLILELFVNSFIILTGLLDFCLNNIFII